MSRQRLAESATLHISDEILMGELVIKERTSKNSPVVQYA